MRCRPLHDARHASLDHGTRRSRHSATARSPPHMDCSDCRYDAPVWDADLPRLPASKPEARSRPYLDHHPPYLLATTLATRSLPWGGIICETRPRSGRDQAEIRDHPLAPMGRVEGSAAPRACDGPRTVADPNASSGQIRPDPARSGQIRAPPQARAAVRPSRRGSICEIRA